jgi:two-component system response regulator AtoC
MTATRGRVLIIDDEENFREFLGEALEAEGYRVTTASTARGGLEKAREDPPDVVLLDQNLPDEAGLAVLGRLQALPVAPPVIMITAYAAYSRAVEAVKKGAFHYLCKPFEFDELMTVVERASAASPAGSRESNPALASLVGTSREMSALKRQVVHLAQSPVATILLQGESGTGKELIARAIHVLSERSQGRLVAVNCAALSDSLLMSELFGHEKGAFTDAREQRKGVFEAAHRGTLFLDEISEMGPRTQATVLRALEQRVVTRLGSSVEIPVDVRIIAATNSALHRLVETREFRADLYYRLNVVTLEVPPLRSRTGDVEVLAEYFSRQMAARYGKPFAEIPRPVLEALASYSWPGNVRELRNVVEHAYAVTDGPGMTWDSLPAQLRGHLAAAAIPEAYLAAASFRDAKRRLVHEFERNYVKQMLVLCGGNVSQAARKAGMHRQGFQRLLARHGIVKDDSAQTSFGD